jgi:hypothetical protein
VLLHARYLFDLLTNERSCAVEVRDVRLRLASVRRERASAEERALASELRRLRERACEGVGRAESCGRCALPGPEGWPGGECCSGRTDRLFTDDELAALGLSGTTPARLTPPRGAHRGCAFRGQSGCSLPPAHRPNMCARYTCRSLGRELCGREGREALARLHEELRLGFERFTALRTARLARAMT